MRLSWKVAAILLMTMMVLSATGPTGYCAGEAGWSAHVVGTWYYVNTEVDGMLFTPEEMGVSITLTLYDSSQFTISYDSGEEDDNNARPIAEWSFEDGRVALFSDGEQPIYYELIDGMLVTEEDGVKLFFGREKPE